jgi:hypothetical protein
MIGTIFAPVEVVTGMAGSKASLRDSKGGIAMNLRMDGWKVSYDGSRAKIVEGPCWAVVTFFRAYNGRELPESHVVESLHTHRPSFDHLLEKYQFPAPGSIKQYDFAYGRMVGAATYREDWSCAPRLDYEDDQSEFVSSDDEQPGMESVYRKVDVIRLTADEVRDLYLDWARTRVAREADPLSLEFALHVLAELGGEARPIA